MLQDKNRARAPQGRARAPQGGARAPQGRARAPRLRAGFETGDLSQWEGRFTPVSLGTGTADITVVRSPVKQGNYAARVEARTEEQTGAQQGTSRSELVRSTKGRGNTGFPVNLTSNSSELWTRWSMYIPSSTVSQLPTDCTVGADGCGITIQQQTSAGNGVFELNGIFLLQQNMTVTYNDSGMTDPAYEPFWTSPPLEPNRWYTFMIHKKYSETNTGFVEIYLDGVQQQLCANAACSSKVSRVTGRTIHPAATIYRLQTGLYYNDNTDATGHKHPVIYIDDWNAYTSKPRPSHLLRRAAHRDDARVGGRLSR
jgi:Polysaccharide lyase